MQSSNSFNETKTNCVNQALRGRLEQCEKYAKKFNTYDSNEEDNKTLMNHIKRENQTIEYKNRSIQEKLEMDRPYRPVVSGITKNAYAHWDSSSRVDDTFERCRVAGVPVVSIPQSVIFELTNYSNNGLNYQQDIVVHTLSNKSRLDQLNAEISKLDENISTNENKINEQIAASKSYYEAYLTCMLNRENASFTVSAINLPSNIQMMLSSKTNSLINETNELLTSGNFNHMIRGSNGDPDVCLKFLNESKTLIEKYANDIFRLKMEKIQVLSDLVREQGKAMTEIQQNPSHELTGDEILTNYYESLIDE
jgi:hypothetical protein